MSWTSNFLKVKGTGILNDVKTMLVKLDVEGASEADIMTLDDNLTILTNKVAEQREVVRVERGQAEEKKAEYNQKYATLEILQADAANETDPVKLGQINDVIADVVADLVALAPVVEQEVQEAEEAEADLAQLQEIAKAGADTLKTARKRLDDAKKNLERQKNAVMREQQREDRAKELAGLSTKLTKLNTALDVMTNEATELKQQADAKRYKTELITPKTGTGSTNDILASAAARAAGTPTPSASVTDRIAGLKKF